MSRWLWPGLLGAFALAGPAGLPASAEPGVTGKPAIAVPGFWDPRRRPERPDLTRLQSIRFMTEIDYPPFEKELSIVRRKVPGAGKALAAQIVGLVQHLRTARLSKVPGVSETLDWAAALAVLHASHLTPEVVGETLGCVVKDEADLRKVRGELLAGRLPVGAA